MESNTKIMHKYLRSFITGDRTMNMADLKTLTKMYSHSIGSGEHIYLRPTSLPLGPAVTSLEPTKYLNLKSKKLSNEPRTVASSLDRNVIEPYLKQQGDYRAQTIISHYSNLVNNRNKFFRISDKSVKDMLDVDNKAAKLNGKDIRNDKEIKGLLKNIHDNSRVEAKSLNNLYRLGDPAVDKITNPRDAMKIDNQRVVARRNHSHINTPLFQSVPWNDTAHITNSMKLGNKRKQEIEKQSIQRTHTQATNRTHQPTDKLIILHDTLAKIANSNQPVSMNSLKAITKSYQKISKPQLYLKPSLKLSNNKIQKSINVSTFKPYRFVQRNIKYYPHNANKIAGQLDNNVVQSCMNQRHNSKIKKITNYYSKLRNNKNKFLNTSNKNVDTMLDVDSKTIDHHNFVKNGNSAGAKKTSNQIKGLLKQINNNAKVEAKSFNNLYILGQSNQKISAKDIMKLDAKRTSNERNGLSDFHNINNSPYTNQFINPLSSNVKDISHCMKISRMRQSNLSSNHMENRLNKLNLGNKLNHANHVSDIQQTYSNKQKMTMNKQNTQVANQSRNNKQKVSINRGMQM